MSKGYFYYIIYTKYIGGSNVPLISCKLGITENPNRRLKQYCSTTGLITEWEYYKLLKIIETPASKQDGQFNRTHLEAVEKTILKETISYADPTRLLAEVRLIQADKIWPKIKSILDHYGVKYKILDIDKIIDPKNNVSKTKVKTIKKPIPPSKNHLTRIYQERIINAYRKHMKTNNNGQIIMATGTGKTHIAQQILLRNNYNKIVCAAPNLDINLQLYKTFRSDFPDHFFICNSSGKINYIDNELVTHPCSRSIKALLEIKTKIFIITTYQSSCKIEGDVDIVIFDEAHNTAVKKTSKNGYLLQNSEKFTAKHRLFLTATPKFSKAKNIHSMDHEEIYGEIIASYTISQAIQDKSLTDFRLTTLELDIKQDPVHAHPKEESFPDENHKVEIISAIINHIFMHFNRKKLVVFCKNRSIANSYYELSKKYNTNVEHLYIDCEISNREEIYKKYIAAEKAVIFNCNILKEGVDLPCIDSILFADSVKSSLSIMQKIGRGLRLFPGKKYC